MTNQTGAAEQKTFIPPFNDTAFNDTLAPPRRRRTGMPGRKSAGACERLVNTTRISHVDRRPPLNHNDSGGADPAQSSQKSDLAFQHAMWCAIVRGLEHPPQIGVVKDRRPLTAPRLFEPVPHSSGCTSPALECADLVARSD